MSSKERRELSSMELTIASAEKDLEKAQLKAGDPASHETPEASAVVSKLLADAQSKVDSLFERWEELEEWSKSQ